jgi:hypothetical protein
LLPQSTITRSFARSLDLCWAQALRKQSTNRSCRQLGCRSPLRDASSKEYKDFNTPRVLAQLMYYEGDGITQYYDLLAGLRAVGSAAAGDYQPRH